MINTMKFGKNTVINSIVREYESRAQQARIDFNYHIISPPLLSMSNFDLTNILTEVLDSMFAKQSHGVFLNINVFSGKIQMECKSVLPSMPNFQTEKVDAILGRNEGMLQTKYHNNEFIIQIVFPIS